MPIVSILRNTRLATVLALLVLTANEALPASLLLTRHLHPVATRPAGALLTSIPHTVVECKGPSAQKAAPKYHIDVTIHTDKGASPNIYASEVLESYCTYKSGPALSPGMHLAVWSMPHYDVVISESEIIVNDPDLDPGFPDAPFCFQIAVIEDTAPGNPDLYAVGRRQSC